GVIFIAFSSDWYGSIFPTGWTLQNFELALGHRLTLASIQNSLIYSLLAIALNVAIGLIVGFLVVRTRVPGRAFLDALTMLPLAVPGIVVAFGYLAMTQHGDFFSFLNPPDAPNPIVLLIIAYAVRKLPFVVRSVVAGLEQTSETYEEAAMSLGATRLRALLLVTFPLITASILAGALLAFSQSMLEVSDSLILASKQEHYPITKAIYDLLGFLGDGKFIASALGVWAMVLLALAIGGASVLLGRKLGAVFRI
ncbi:MAG: ABC transporter permease subunit, partial [Opitutales bacterium]|nr:ABC transporter permease subunit [Opitutales bacterium]